MQTQKRASALPAKTVQEFEQAVGVGQPSTTLTRLMENWLEKRHEEALRQNIIEGCREMWDVYVDTERDFHPLEEEAARAEGQANDPDKQ
jgi:hypothetical protein